MTDKQLNKKIDQINMNIWNGNLEDSFRDIKSLSKKELILLIANRNEQGLDIDNTLIFISKALNYDR